MCALQEAAILERHSNLEERKKRKREETKERQCAAAERVKVRIEEGKGKDVKSVITMK